jgi:3-oxoacyl-[acyl-carrier protein] reductase
MSVLIDLSGKKAIVTGASRGIGAAIARALHAAGASVLLNHPGLDSTRTETEAIAAELNQIRTDSASAVAADVSSAEAVAAMFEKIRLDSGPIDILVNNAAILRDRTVSKMTLDEWNDVIDINLSGVFYCSKFGLEAMNDGGSIVNLASVSGLGGFFGQANYAAAKAGVVALTRVLARESAKRSIRVNAVAPGVVETAMAATIPETSRAEMLKSIPLKRFANPNEIASIVLFLCSDLASYIDGETIVASGGWSGW